MHVSHKTFLITVFVMILFGAGLGWPGENSTPVLFVLDASGSMWGRVGSVEKIVVAKGTLIELLGNLRPEDRVGLIAYGHRREGDCDDIELLAPIQAGRSAKLAEHVQSLNPKGKTPIVRALRLAAEQVQAMSDEVAVVLLSDGRETCDEAPCEFVATLKKQGVRLRLYVIGFDVGEEEKAQLSCLAEAGGGAYYSAETAGELQQALQQVTERLEETVASETGTLVVTAGGTDLYRVFDASGAETIDSARTNSAVELAAGFYKVKLGRSSQLVRVRQGEETRLGAGTLVVSGLGKSLYSVFDVTGEEKVDFTRTNRPMDLLEGSYLVELEGTRRVVIVAAGKTTTVKAAGVVVNGDSGALYGVYDPTGETKYQFTRVGRPIEVLPGFYSIKVGKRWIRDIELEDGEHLEFEE
ncbi:MAG: VWA domain-containing protein [Thermoanaerobaculales bacterium]|nr:VWA domain-containing protein [Thermoanaerobaculales bacterium]